MWAFIDEYGNTNIATDKAGVSQYFIVAAVLVGEDNLAQARVGADEVRARFFQTGEMKSKKLGADRGRWARLLADLSGLPFHFYGLAVDKARLDPASGFQWKDSFYKNLCGRAYGKLMRAHRGLHVRADEHGRTEFMESFADYIRRNHQPDLFERGTFEFVNGKTEVFVQLADIIAGLLARAYDRDKLLPKAHELLGIVRGNALLLDEWPPRYRMRSGSGELSVLDGPDERIARHSMDLAEEFVASNDDSRDEDVRARVAVLERLLFERRFGEGSRPVATAALLDNLRTRGFGEKGDNWLRRNVIARLRDRGLLITSSSHGYKLPERRADLVAFVRHAESVCVPMINRVRSACDITKLATAGDVDVLSDEELATVRKMADVIENDRIVVEPVEP